MVSSENEENWWRPELFEKHTRHLLPDSITILSSPPEENLNYNCFVYALELQEDKRFLGNQGWDFTRELGVVFDEMIKRKILQPVIKPRENDLVVYRSIENKISHVGLMSSDDEIISKWSWGPLLKHSLWDVPDHYGDRVEYYTNVQGAKNFIVSLE